jgi:hypothetical protein
MQQDLDAHRCPSSQGPSQVLPPPIPFTRQSKSSSRPPAGPSNQDVAEHGKVYNEYGAKTVDPFDGILEALMNIGLRTTSGDLDKSIIGEDLASMNKWTILNKS